MHTPEDTTEVSLCVGTFDSFGIPIAITKPYGDAATVAFQSITLNLLVAQCFNQDPASVAYIYNEDGSRLRIERNLKGFISYLEEHRDSDIRIEP
jgi:hypothetical protein